MRWLNLEKLLVFAIGMFERFFIVEINFVAGLMLAGQDFCFVKIVVKIELGHGLKLRLYPCLNLLEYSLTSFIIN